MKHIALAGYGAVGTGFHQILTANGTDDQISLLGVNNLEKHKDVNLNVTTNFLTELNSDEHDITLELISDSVVGADIIKKSLQEGIPVISANKKAIADNLGELLALQQETNTPFLYEASVAGSIPIIRLLEDYFSHDSLNKVKGIINGSSNFILSCMNHKRQSYFEALEDAQRLGFAEADPTLDVSGQDALNKLCIIILHAYGTVVKPEEVFTYGIEQVNTIDFAIAAQLGCSIKLVATTTLKDGIIQARVCPTFLPKKDILADIEWENNCIAVTSEYAGEQSYFGKGAGSLPTGTAVYADYASLKSGYQYQYSKHAIGKHNTFSNTETGNFLFISKKPEDLLSIGVSKHDIVAVKGRYASIFKGTHATLFQEKERLQQTGIALYALPEEITSNNLHHINTYDHITAI